MATQCFYTKCANKTQTGQGHNVMTYSKHVQFKYNCNTECDSTQNKNMLNHFYWCTICSNKPIYNTTLLTDTHRLRTKRLKNVHTPVLCNEMDIGRRSRGSPTMIIQCRRLKHSIGRNTSHAFIG